MVKVRCECRKDLLALLHMSSSGVLRLESQFGLIHYISFPFADFVIEEFGVNIDSRPWEHKPSYMRKKTN
jgi:hypothetical protein